MYRPALGAKVERHDVVVRCDVVTERFQDASCVCDQDTYRKAPRLNIMRDMEGDLGSYQIRDQRNGQCSWLPS